MAQNFKVSPIGPTAISTTQFQYQPIMDTVDINGNTVQVYGQIQSFTPAQLNAQITALQSQLNTLLDIQTSINTQITAQANQPAT